ncbi:YugN family protein [Chengkuizengella axinellae]|uniref:YugN family protein n=1 Tax=Chengkuizengella axinellae TaxID=3064388 RepID=A0ABT9J178_9BACL|nr:YugN family protein [Chengkuizengella sp. 2205SS18-9]MDP5275177.1 YugN family protein [Chengkuizengella sp. 2205SS18-9]
MKQIKSEIENKEDLFSNLYKGLKTLDFSLGANWDYEHGYFDRALDEKSQVWLRIPFQVTSGQLDGEIMNQSTMIQLGTPFALKHVYNEGTDPNAHMQVYASLINQFQTPLDKDAELEQEWIAKAEELIKKVELQI